MQIPELNLNDNVILDLELPKDKTHMTLKYLYSNYLLGDDILYTEIPENVLIEIEKDIHQIPDQILVDRASKSRSRLAGDISKEFHFRKDETPFIYDQTKNILLKTLSETLPIHDIFLDEMWINFQHANEHNPLHSHNGLLSFVYYLNVPETIRLELDDQGSSTNARTRGAIQFLSSYTACSMTILPKRGDMFIFNASHRHLVYPFYNEGQRVSISGSILYCTHHNY